MNYSLIALIIAFTACAVGGRDATTTRTDDFPTDFFRYEARAWDEQSAKWFSPPALAVISRRAHEPIYYDVQVAFANRLPPGSREVVASVGGPAPAGAKLKLLSSNIAGSRITVRAAYDATDVNKASRDKVYLFAACYLPSELADGTYDFELIIDDVPDELARRADGNGIARILSTTIQKPHPHAARVKEFVERLRTLSDDELITEYYRIGDDLKAAAVGPRDDRVFGIAMFELEDPRYVIFQIVRSEMSRCMPALAPDLIALLRKEWARNANRAIRNYPYGYARDLLALLGNSRNAATAAAMVDMLDTPAGTIYEPLRYEALQAIEKLTYVTFRPASPHQNQYADAVPDNTEAPLVLGFGKSTEEQVARYAEFADRYRRWLKDPRHAADQWLSQAQRRSRTRLHGDDLDAVYCSAAFLTAWLPEATTINPVTRDDDPADTIKRVSEVLSRVRATPALQIDGRPLPVALGNWTGFLARYGPLSQPHVDLLINLQAVAGPPGSWYELTHLSQIGGPTVVRKFIEWRPVIERQIAEQKLDQLSAQKSRELTIEQRWLLIHRRTLLWGVQRWTGHAFRDWAEIDDWWAKNKGKSQEQWMREGLRFTAERADAGQADAQSLLRSIVPDLPKDDNELPLLAPPWESVFPHDPPRAPFRVFRATWIEADQDQLRFDPTTGTFQLKK